MVAAGVKVTVVADRGFGNGPIQCVSEELGFEYVLRIRGDFYVTNAKGERRLASDWVGAKGRSRTLRAATVTESEVAVGTVVWAPGSGRGRPGRPLPRRLIVYGPGALAWRFDPVTRW